MKENNRIGLLAIIFIVIAIIEDYLGSYLHGLIDNEIQHLEKELNAI